MESLTPRPELENSQGQKRQSTPAPACLLPPVADNFLKLFGSQSQMQRDAPIVVYRRRGCRRLAS